MIIGVCFHCQRDVEYPAVEVMESIIYRIPYEHCGTEIEPSLTPIEMLAQAIIETNERQDALDIARLV